MGDNSRFDQPTEVNRRIESIFAEALNDEKVQSDLKHAHIKDQEKVIRNAKIIMIASDMELSVHECICRGITQYFKDLTEYQNYDDAEKEFAAEQQQLNESWGSWNSDVQDSEEN